ncbi:hypothetical protein LCGC14_0541600 [marine sediment metagenome]|uniref:Uncharacterized protein n=1 Tax=marine sediment metagenome TaxID=412755 RepID=A0A0F9V0R6_9ZZZZ
MKGKIKMRMDLRPLKRLQKRSPKFFAKAMEKGAVQLLNWSNNGSMKESRKPPIRWGVLRGSSSAFVGNKLILIFPQSIISGSKEKVTPAHSGAVAGLVITVVWNTDYAMKMHEWKGGWGKFTERDMDAGNKWIEKHLKNDREDLMEVIRIEFKKEVGM